MSEVGAVELTVSAQQGSYPLWIGEGELTRSWGRLEPVLAGRRVAIVTHRRIRRLWGRALTAGWPEGLRPTWIEVPIGEQAKSLSWVRRLTSRLARQAFRRDDCLVALGGGVVGDLTGFVAATYLRGIDFVQVPTSLVAQVDSSVGGKTGVNLPQGKNLVGAFHAPRAVLIDPHTLASLPRRELLSGQAEVVKYGLIRDREFFERCRRELPDPPAWTPILAACVRHKAAVVEADEREAGERRSLNLGHTMGHAIEAAGKFRRYLHGEAVALGIRFVYRVARRLGEVTEEDLVAVESFFRESGVAPAWPRFSYRRLERWMERDKKASRVGVRWILPTGIGSWRLAEGISPELFAEVHRELFQEEKQRGREG